MAIGRFSLLPAPPANHAMLAIVFGSLALAQAAFSVRDPLEAFLPVVALLVIIAVASFAFSHRSSARSETFAVYTSLLSWPFLFFAWMIPGVMLIFGSDDFSFFGSSIVQQIMLIICGIQLMRMFLIMVMASQRGDRFAPPTSIETLSGKRNLSIAVAAGLLAYVFIDQHSYLQLLNGLAVSTIAIDILGKVDRRNSRV